MVGCLVPDTAIRFLGGHRRCLRGNRRPAAACLKAMTSRPSLPSSRLIKCSFDYLITFTITIYIVVKYPSRPYFAASPFSIPLLSSAL